ncbi:MAG: hypothetical protein DELT_00731 [Desulfovibrio sp.]
MRTDTAKQIILSLLAEKGLCLPEDSDMRTLIALAVESGPLPEEVAGPLMQAFSVAASDSVTPSESDQNGKPRT